MKKIIGIGFCFFLIISLPSLKAQDIDYKKWLNEDVYWLITSEEKDAFKKLETDQERNEFIALFWAKRDPTPRTEKNEFKEAYYSRLEYVNLKFTRGQNVGWKTDMGKVLIFFGVPQERHANPETWIYEPIQSLNMTEKFQVVFNIVEEGGEEIDQKKATFVIDDKLTSKSALDVMSDYSRRTLFHPQLKEVPQYPKIFVHDPGSVEGKIISEADPSEALHEDIPIDHSFSFSKAEHGSTRITLVYFFDPDKTDLKQSVLFGRVSRGEEVLKDFKKKIKHNKQDHYAFIEFPVIPGEYDLVFGIRDENSERYSLEKDKITVPNYWTDRINIGNLILTNRVEMITPGSVEASAFNFGQHFAHPKKDNIYKKSENLNILYQIYNPARKEGKVSILQEVFLKKGKRTYKLPGSVLEREVPEGQVLVSGFPIPLASVEAGEYELLVKITDQISNNIVQKTRTIVIED